MSRIAELFDEAHEKWAILLFVIATIALFAEVPVQWPHVALFVTALVTMKAVRVRRAGPAGVEFGGDDE